MIDQIVDNVLTPLMGDGYKAGGMMKHIAFILVFSTILLCSCDPQSIKDSRHKITAEMALEGVSNYCHSAYD